MDTIALNASYSKLYVSMRYWLLGRRYFTALKAMEFAAQYHTGTRKDGAPEFSHQIWQAHYLRTIEASLMDPERCLVTTFLHDVVEDYPVTVAMIADLFGADNAASVERISKEVEGRKKTTEAYFAEMAKDPVASICKGVDRIHNHQTMKGAFSEQKQASYLIETEEDILPLLKMGRRAFPEQEAAYENIKHVLLTQIELIRVTLSADA